MLYRFEWDPRKAAANFRKHGVRFADAATVFRDPRAISLFDEDHGDEEERWITIGIDPTIRVLVVVHTFVCGGSSQEVTIRVISARRATDTEKQTYNRRFL